MNGDFILLLLARFLAFKLGAALKDFGIGLAAHDEGLEAFLPELWDCLGLVLVDAQVLCQLVLGVQLLLDRFA